MSWCWQTKRTERDADFPVAQTVSLDWVLQQLCILLIWLLLYHPDSNKSSFNVFLLLLMLFCFFFVWTVKISCMKFPPAPAPPPVTQITTHNASSAGTCGRWWIYITTHHQHTHRWCFWDEEVNFTRRMYFEHSSSIHIQSITRLNTQQTVQTQLYINIHASLA